MQFYEVIGYWRNPKYSDIKLQVENLENVTPWDVCMKIKNGKGIFEPHPLYYLVHYPARKNQTYIGPDTYFLSMKGKNMQAFEGRTDKSLSVFGIERARKQVNVLRMYKSMKTVMNKPQSVTSKYSFIA